jgi:hypothetical protein
MSGQDDFGEIYSTGPENATNPNSEFEYDGNSTNASLNTSALPEDIYDVNLQSQLGQREDATDM